MLQANQKLVAVTVQVGKQALTKFVYGTCVDSLDGKTVVPKAYVDGLVLKLDPRGRRGSTYSLY